MSRKICGIYIIRNKINNKMYIGQSTNITRRWREHRNRYKNPNGQGYETHIYRSFRNYGIENFSFEILEECENLDQREINLISEYKTHMSNNGYNETLEGKGGTQVLYVREKIGNSLKGRKFTEDHKRKIGESSRGRPCPGPTRVAVAAANRKRVWSEKARNKRREIMSGSNNPLARKVICLETGVIYDTITEAGKENNRDISSVCKSCKEKIKHVKGLSFRYI